ncbi:MAG TPA: TetR/AcrR family transcriptional regulator [Frankiaceae bacterium]|nr:TetR/AcrR family transcriptional regulator [Frankiaceae bacterium]
MEPTNPNGRDQRTTRLDRRKARTREALIEAAVQLIGEGRGERASIQEITDTADVGFGSFYNHFQSKEQLFHTASEQLLERWGRLIDASCSGMTDTAQIFAVSYRISCRLSWTHPEIARFLVGAGFEVLDSTLGLSPRALRDIRAGQAAGRFTFANAELALHAAAGGLLGLLRIYLTQPEQLDLSAADDLTEAMLRMLGVGPDEAAALVAEPLPDVVESLLAQ